MDGGGEGAGARRGGLELVYDGSDCAAAAEELKGLGVDELARRINALHSAAAAAGEGQHAALSGTGAYFNRVRSSR